MITKELSTKIVKSRTHGAGVIVLRREHISFIAKMHNFIKQKKGQDL